jgi:hypothetical protein
MAVTSTSDSHEHYVVASIDLTRLRGCEVDGENRQDGNIFGGSNEGC